MMYLDIQPYCHKCPQFDPKKDATYIKYPNGRMYAKEIKVFCANAVRCEQIARYLRQELSEEKKDDQG